MDKNDEHKTTITREEKLQTVRMEDEKMYKRQQMIRLYSMVKRPG